MTAALTAFVGALFVGAALLLLLLLSSRGGPRQVQVPVAARGNGPADADRRALVQACIYVRDRVTSKALGDRLGAALQEAGVDDPGADRGPVRPGAPRGRRCRTGRRPGADRVDRRRRGPRLPRP